MRKLKTVTVMVAVVMTAGCVNKPKLPVVLTPAPTIVEEIKTIEEVSETLKDAAHQITKASVKGRGKAPNLQVWDQIESKAFTVKQSAEELDVTVDSLEKDEGGIRAFENNATQLVKDNDDLTKEVKRLKDDSSRKTFFWVSAFGGGLIALAALLLWVDRKWAIMAAISGTSILVAVRVLVKVLQIVDMLVPILFVTLLVTAVGWLIYKYRKKLYELVTSVQKAKEVLPEDVRKQFGSELSKLQDTAIKKDVARIKTKLPSVAEKKDGI